MKGGLTALLVAMVALPGCGGGSSNGASGTPPDELVGTYTTTLEASDIANDAPELRGASGHPWTLRIGAGGGPDDGPYLAIDVAPGDNLEAPALRVDGDRLLLLDEECAGSGATAATYDFYDNEYRWSLEGDTLTIETVQNQCPDRVAETILTSRPWTRSA